MKTICRLSDYTDGPNISLYLFADDKQVLIESDKTTIGDPSNPDMYIMDCDSSNVVLHEGVAEPNDWFGWKYFYTADGGWVLNEDWIDPRLPKEELPTKKAGTTETDGSETEE